MPLLDTPDVRQRGDFDCGAAAVETVLRVLGVRATAAVVLADAVDGLHPATIEAALRRAGVPVQSGTMTVADLKHHTALGRPVLCPVALHGGHWVVVRGARRDRVFFHCPVDGRLSAAADAWDVVWRDSTRSGHPFDRWGIAAGR